MLNRKTFVAIIALVLAGAVAFAGVPAEKQLAHLTRVHKKADGTVDLKQVAGYTGYESDNEYHAKIKNTTDPEEIARLKAKHNQLNILEENPGGMLHGVVESGTSVVTFELTGVGRLEGLTDTISMPARFEVHSSPQTGADIDTLETNMYRIEGATVRGDKVFEYIRLVGGTGNGYNSPGQMTLITKGNQVMVDSFFNVGFRLDFKGAAGGPLDGIEDSIEANVTMRAHGDQQAVTGSH